MSGQEKQQPRPDATDSPILVRGMLGHRLSHPVVLVFDIYGMQWRGLLTRRSGKPTKAWLEDQAIAPNLINDWVRLRPEREQVEKGQRIGVNGMSGANPRADAPAVHFAPGGPGALDVPASSLFQKESGLQYPQRDRGAES